MEFGFIEEYGSVYNITVKHPSIEIPATLRAVPAKISITIGSHTVSNSLAPDIEGCFVTWRESLTVSGITKGTRQLTLQLFLEDQSQWVSVTTTISFATQRKRIIVGDQFSKGYLDLRIQTLKNELTSIEALRTPRATRLASNIQIDLTQRIINEVAEDDIEDLPLEGIDSFLQQNSQITQTPVTQNSQPLIEVFTPKAIETSLIKLTPGCVSEIVQSICEPTALTLETLPQMIALELCPVPLNDFCVGDDEVVLFGLEEFEQNRFRSRTCYHPTASSFCQDQSQPLNRTTLACQLVESPPQAISQPQTSSVQEQHAFIVADNVGDCLFIDTVSEDSSQSGSHQQLVMSTPITINAHQQTEQSSEMVVQKNSQQIDYSMQQEEVMEEHPRHEVEAKSTKFLEKWPQVLECCSDSDRQIERLVHQELSNIRCRVAIAEACADKLTIKAADPSVSKIPPAAVRQEERASRNVQPTPLAASTIIPQKEDQVIVQPDKKQIRPANISNVGQVEQQRFDPLKEFAKSLRSAYGDKIYENKSATTLQKSVLCYSVPKANRFLKARVQDTGTTYFTGSCFQNSKAKGTSFGFGNRKAYPLWLERNMKENPAPNSYQEVQGSSPRLPKGYSFGLSYHYYQKASIFEAQQPKKSPTMPAINKLRSKSRRDIYASLTKQTGSGGNYHFMSGSQLARAGGLRNGEKRFCAGCEQEGLQYGWFHVDCLQKVFCCRFLHCCQANDESLLTSKDRKSMFIKLAKRYERTLSQHEQVKPFHMLMTLFIQNGELYSEMMEKVRIHSSSRHSREDLEFYVPQLCTYLVFHEEMHSPELINLLERACKLDLHFAHRFYLYLNSLAVIGSSHEVVAQYLDRLVKIMATKWSVPRQPPVCADPIVQSYHSRHLKQSQQAFSKLQDLEVREVYRSLYFDSPKLSAEENNIFAPTLEFLRDLVTLSEKLVARPNRREFLVSELSKINQKLPALVHLPLHKNSIREKTVLNILYEESKIFATKERAPYSIVLELFYDASQHQKVPVPPLSGTTKKLHREGDNQVGTVHQLELVTPRHNHDEGTTEALKQHEPSPEKKLNKFQLLNKFFHLRKKNREAVQLVEQRHEDEKQSEEAEPYMPEIFPESFSHKLARISKYSPYSQLPQYELITLIVKSNDNLKQEQFAMQLLQMFKDIFQNESIPLELYPYQIVSVSHNSGIIEFMDDCLTIDELKRRDSSLIEVVKGRERLHHFVRSLAAYSLITYLLQVKDRHNGNIMICRDGSLRHIDYGFFISNSPGKGVEMEKKVPFKLPSQYVEVMGGLDSKHFHEFRKLFYQGFNALRKHQDRILILVNLMYSSHGTTMPCFERGQQCIQQLEQRFNPESIHTDAQLSVFCQGLINASIDNWRARWYDKWQYVAQGILY